VWAIGSTRWLAAAVIPLLAALGCGDDDGGDTASAAGEVRVVTTVAPITSLVAAIVGAGGAVRGIVPEGTNSHTFEPPPSVAEALADADVVFMNGLQLEEPARALARSNMRDAPLVLLGDAVLEEGEYIYDFSFPRSGGKPNPHVWTDPTRAQEYAGVILDTMVEVDPAGEALYRRNHAALVERIGALHEAMTAAVATIPPENRRLLTYHDSFPYMADTYGLTVVGAIQPRDFTEPTPREVARLIDQVRDESIPAVFGSEVFPSPVLEQIGRETGARYVDVLRDDDLPGEPGEPEHSYVGLMRFDFVTIVEALGGDPGALRALAVEDGAGDTARYPQ